MLASELMDSGNIINITSIYAVDPNKDSVLASGVKVEAEAYTKALAKKFAGKIRVNSIAPGYTDTPLLKKSISNDFINKMIRKQGRLVKPEEIAVAVIKLIVGKQTGQTVVVDGRKN